MLAADFILANTDRHLGNFGFLRDSETLEWKGTALGDEWLYLQSKHNYTKLKKIGDYWYAK